MSVQYIQGGAEWRTNGGKKTKTALRTAIKEDPSSVVLFATSQMGPQFNDSADKLPDDTVFNVVGPDPYTKRDWYASVQRNNRGSLTVK